jgi:hypothetical protein
MRAEWLVTLIWAALNAVLLGLQFVFPTHVEAWELTGGVVGSLLVLAAILWLLRRRGEPPLRRVPDTSYATVCAAIGVAIAIVGLAFGPWLYLPGIGLLVLGLAGIGRELVAARRTVP